MLEVKRCENYSAVSPRQEKMSYDEIKDPVPGGQWSSGICDCFSDCRYLARPGSFAMDLEQLEGASEGSPFHLNVAVLFAGCAS